MAKLRGYSLRVVMPENVSIERRQLLEIFGAEITLSPGEEGSNGAIRMAEKIAADSPEYVLLFQYGNPANPLAHYEGTGPEILRDCPEVDVFVAGLGTSGTLMGVGRLPQGAQARREGRRGRTAGRRAGAGLAQPRRRVRPADLRSRGARPEVHRAAARVGGVDAAACSTSAACSPASRPGAAVAGAVKMAKTMDAGTIVVLLPDGGWKYLSSGAWTDPLDEVVERGDAHQLLVTAAVPDIDSRGRGAAARWAGRVPDRDRVRPRRRRGERRRAAPAVRA